MSKQRDSRKPFKREYVCRLYGPTITLLVCSLEELGAICRRQFNDPDFTPARASAAKTITHEDEDGFIEFVLWLPKWTGEREQVLSLSHECQHLANAILRHVNVKFTEESEEAFVYLAENLLRNFWETLSGNVKKSKRANRRTSKQQRHA